MIMSISISLVVIFARAAMLSLTSSRSLMGRPSSLFSSSEGVSMLRDNRGQEIIVVVTRDNHH
jgi:hypothetical protein